MGKHSCLGPFDPQLGGVACQSVLKKFEDTKEDIKKNSSALGLWQVIINKYPPTFLYSCVQAVALTNELADKLIKKVIKDDSKLDAIKKVFNDNSESKVHSRHLSIAKLQKLGLNVTQLEEDQTLQDMMLSLHHCYMILLENTNVCKCLENNIGGRYIHQINMIQRLQQVNKK